MRDLIVEPFVESISISPFDTEMRVQQSLEEQAVVKTGASLDNNMS
jgi:hypothetical protein